MTPCVCGAAPKLRAHRIYRNRFPQKVWILQAYCPDCGLSAPYVEFKTEKELLEYQNKYDSLEAIRHWNNLIKKLTDA